MEELDFQQIFTGDLEKIKELEAINNKMEGFMKQLKAADCLKIQWKTVSLPTVSL